MIKTYVSVFFIVFSLSSLIYAQIDTIFTENFEGIFPGTKWVVGDSNENGGLDYWDDVSYRAYEGYWSGWCAAIGTQTGSGFGMNYTDYDIYDFTCVSSSINITSQAIGSCDIVDSISVRVMIYHTYRSDLVIRLFSPANRDTFLLFHREGGSADNIDTIFELKGSILSRVDSTNGTWRLVVCDSASGDIGYLDYWTITIYYTQDNYCAHRYDNYMEAFMTTTINFDSLNARGTDIVLSFRHLMPSIETGVYDWGAVYIDDIQVGPRFSSTVSSWSLVSMNLTDSLYALPSARGTHTLSFRFTSDYSVTGEGWYIDDIKILSRKPNIQPYAAFTGGYIVPSNVPGTQTVSPVLTGNGTTYLDAWTAKNNSSYDATDTILVRVLLDNEPITAYDRYVSRLNAADTVFYTDRAITVKGGRHTLTTVVDATNRVNESDELDNTYSAQFVWSPMTLSQGVPITRDTPPEPGEMYYVNCDGFTYPQSYLYWSGCAIRPPADADYDLNLYYHYSNSTSGFDSVVAGSYYGTGEIDFVLRDGNHSSSTNYVGVYNFSGSGNFTIEADYNQEAISSGTNGPFTIAPGNIIRIWDTFLNPRTRYCFLLQNSVDGMGDADLDIYLFSSQDRIYTKSRFDYVAQSSSNGPGGDEMFMFTNTDTLGDWFAFVLINKGATSTTKYTITRSTNPLMKVTLTTIGLDPEDSTTVRYRLLGNNLTKKLNGTWIGYVDSNSVVSVDGIVRTTSEDTRYFASAPYWWLIRTDTAVTVNYTKQYMITAGAETAPAGDGSSALNDSNSVPVWCEISSNFEDISNYPGRQEIWNDGSNHDDEAIGPYPIGFNFPFFGSSYSSFYITSNGFIVLSISYPLSAPIPYIGCLREGGLFSFTIMAYGTDLIYRSGQSRIYYTTLQNPRRLVVQFNNMYHYGDFFEPCSFEIVLYESGEIGFYYRTVMPSFPPLEIGVAEYNGKYFNDAPSTEITSGSGYSLFGSQFRTFDGTQDTLWVSAGFNYHFGSISNFSDYTHRWATNMDTTYIAEEPTTKILTYYEQFRSYFNCQVVPPGIPMDMDNAVIIYAKQFGIRGPIGYVYDGFTLLEWVDAFPVDTSGYIYFSPVSTGSNAIQRWTHSPTGEGYPYWAPNEPRVYEALYYHQLRDLVSGFVQPPGNPTNSMNYIGLWYRSCSGMHSKILYDSVSESIWADAGTTIKVNFISSGSNASFTGGESGNLALSATASSSGGGTGPYAPSAMNDNDTSTYHWLTPGTGSYIQLEWESEKVIGWMKLVTNDCENVLSGGLLEYWNGSIWVTVDTITGEKSSFNYVFRSPIVTTKLRIKDITGYGSGDRDDLHPAIIEWEIYSTDSYNNRQWVYCGPSSELEFAPSGDEHSFGFYDQVLVRTSPEKGNPPTCTDPIPAALMMIYKQCGSSLTDTIGKTIWQDTNDTIRFESLVVNPYSRWSPETANEIITTPGEHIATYYHQHYVSFSSPIKLNEPECSHPVPMFEVVERYDKGTNNPVYADGSPHWTDCGSYYRYEDPKDISPTERWDIITYGEGTVLSATSIEPTVYHLWRPTIYLPGTESPLYLVNTIAHYFLGTNVGGIDYFSIFNDWVDCGSALEFAECTHPAGRCTEDERSWTNVVSAFVDTIRYGFFEVTIRTSYTGGFIIVDGDTNPSPHTTIWGPGSIHTIGAVSPHTLGTTRMVWYRWSDMGTQIHTVIADERVTEYIAYYYPEYQCIANKNPAQNYGSITINGTRYDSTSSVSFWVPAESTALLEVSEKDYGPVYFYTFSRWSDGGTRIHRTSPITSPTIFTAYYDSTLIQLNIIISRTSWDIGRIDPLTTVVTEDTQMVLITNMGNVPITLGLRAIDASGLWFASLSPDSNKFVLRAILNDSYTHPPATSYHPTRDVVYSSSTRWASSTTFGPGGYNIEPPPSRETTENLWLMFIAPSYSSDWSMHTINLTITAKLYLP